MTILKHEIKEKLGGNINSEKLTLVSGDICYDYT